MTCRGYDPRAVKVSKTVKRYAATFTDNAKRRSLIRSYAQAEYVNARTKSRSPRGEKSE